VFIRAARYLGVAPWELLEQPYAWTIWAITAEGAEGEAQEALIEQAKPSA
jgi:hypothetical protein